MNTKSLFLFSTVTLAFAAVAVYVSTSSRPETTAQAKAGSTLFADLRARVNDVSTLRVTSADEIYTLERVGDGWGLAEKGGYPVDLDKVKGLVLGISELELVEEKTGNPELFARLEVQDPRSAPDAPSRRVELLDAKGTLLADVIIGRELPARGGGTPHLYVRRTDVGPALEVSGRVRVETSSAALLDREIAKLERKRVRKVTVQHPDGERLVVERESPDETEFSVADLPEGAELSWPGVAGGVAGALEYLNLEDVRAKDAPFEASDAVLTRYESFDGLVVIAESLESEGQLLVRVRAEYDEALRAPAPVGPPGADGETPVEPDSAGLSPEEVRAEVESINARVAEWIYVVPGYAGSNLRKRQADLLAQPEGPEDGGGDSLAPLPFGELEVGPVEEQPVEQPVEVPVEVPSEEPEGGGR